MKSQAIITVALMGVFACSGAALAQKLPRHLVYKVGVNVTTQTEELTMGENGNTATAGSGVAHYGGIQMSHGTMTVDVIGLFPDGGLAVQVSEDTDNRKAPPVRVDVATDGDLRIPADQITNVTEEEQALLRMLGREFVNSDDVNAGKWVHQLSQGGANVREDYTITGTQPNGDLSIAVNQTVKVSGAQPSDTTAHGTITYSNKFKVPRSISLDGRTHHEGVQQTQTEDTKMNFDLLSDSFQAGS
ncbi:MAG: hypothetical protein JO177_04995 [Candidatus Eremiobacteraeota bacterium]|nr:hypothetical protein [Candidatus Eremiobacteraeota bacterium]